MGKKKKIKLQSSIAKIAEQPVVAQRRFAFIFPLAAVLVLTFIVFSPSLKTPFCHLDDQIHVLENPSILGLDFPHIKSMFTRTVSEIYVPVTYLSYAIEYKIAGYQPFIYHLDNLLLHLAVTAMVFILGLRLGLSRRAAAIGSLIFGVHPMHVESVVWITERKDVLYSFFYLLSVYFYLNFLEKKPASYFWSLFFGLLSILAKPMALSLPLVLGVCDWFKKRKYATQLILEKIPYFLFIVPITWITYALHARIPGKSFGEGILVWIWSLTFYLKKFFFPLDVYPDYAMPHPVALGEPAFFSAVILFVFLIGCLYWLRKERWFIFACLYFFVSIFFLLRFDDSKDAHIVADRFMYLPSLGLCLWLGFVGDKVAGGIKKEAKLVAVAVIFVILLTLGIKTFTQSRLWGKELDLWSYVITKEPHSFFAYNSRGNLYVEDKNYPAAIADFSSAIKFRPDYTPAYINRGMAYGNTKQDDLALQDYNTAVNLNNGSLDYALINRGYLYRKIKKDDLALQDFNKAIELNPLNPYAYHNRGSIYAQRGQDDLALADYNQALGLKRDLIKTYIRRGEIYLQKNLMDLALQDFNTVLQYDSQDAVALFERSFVYYTQKNFPAALKDAMQAKALGIKVNEKYLEDIKKKSQL